MNGASPLKTVGLLLGVFAVGIAGVLVGSALRSGTARTDAYIAVDPAAASLLKRGMEFPDTPLRSADDDTLRTADLVGAGGAVFVFLDLECPPCVDMARRWQDVVDGGALTEVTIVGVTNQSPELVRAFREEHGLRFPIVQDPEHHFLRQWGVSRFPLEVVVGPDRRIRSLTYDARQPVDLSELAARLAG